jgi:hypothetical protein
MANGVGTMVRPSPHHPKFNGSSLAASAESGKKENCERSLKLNFENVFIF